MKEKKIPDDELLRLLEIFAKDDEPNGVRLLAAGALGLIHRLQSENERLTEENGQLNGYNSGLEYEVEQRQKQVDELTEQLKKLKLAHTSLCDECADYCPRVPQAVKDTAKEILITAIQLSDMCESFYEFQNRLIDFIEVNYSVEIVRETIIPAKNVEVE
jgi:SMC interacting uncharacterized protein involved in chromosome segregation